MKTLFLLKVGQHWEGGKECAQPEHSTHLSHMGFNGISMAWFGL